MANKLTPEIIEARKKDVIERLQRSPKLTMSHFQTVLGYSTPFLHKLRDEGVKFGKPVKVHLSLK